MPLPRTFIPSDLKSGQKIILDEAPSHHLLQVLRLSVGKPLVIFNNTDKEFNAKICGVSKRRVEAVIEESVSCNRESPLLIHLGQGISRGEKMDFTIQKATELGVRTITPLFAEHCNVKLEGSRLEKRMLHWQKVAISAAEQSGRCYVPEVLPAKSLAKWVIAAKSDLCLIFDPEATDKLNSIKKKPKSITVLVGSEGGLSGDEIKLAKKNSFLPITLGPRILRTETAALAAIGVLQAKWGDF